MIRTILLCLFKFPKLTYYYATGAILYIKCPNVELLLCISKYYKINTCFEAII